MVDIEQVTYDVLSLAVPGVKCSAEYPQSFERHGLIKQMDNSVKMPSSSRPDHFSRIAVQIQVWMATPEGRNEVERQVDDAMLRLGLLRGSPNHLEDEQEDGTVLYRTVLLYNGVYDNNTKRFYRS